jgi:hypothetical protein
VALVPGTDSAGAETGRRGDRFIRLSFAAIDSSDLEVWSVTEAVERIVAFQQRRAGQDAAQLHCVERRGRADGSGEVDPVQPGVRVSTPCARTWYTLGPWPRMRQSLMAATIGARSSELSQPPGSAVPRPSTRLPLG